MRVSVEKLRRWILLGAALLAVVLAGFVMYARYRARHFLHDLPARLGADIKSETNGFTYSQSIKGKTLFTIHASKAIQRQNGKTTLHDVSIELYERDHGEDAVRRTDRISGAEFEYDQPNGIVRAAGEVHIDLETPAAPTDHNAPGAQDSRIHMRTSGLVFDQKQGIASTDQPIDFRFHDVQGDAVGAEFNSYTGVLVLKQNVHLLREDDGKVSTLNAANAEIRRNDHVAHLQSASYEADGQSLQADTLHVDLDKDGSPEQMRGEGVTISDRDGNTIRAPRAIAAVGADHRIHDARLLDGVRFVSTSGSGEAHEAHLLFDTKGQAESSEFTGNVHVRDAVDGEQRELVAQKVTIAPLFGDADKQIVASGHAQWSTQGKESTRLSADVLRATVSGGRGDTLALRHVRGEGHSTMEQVIAGGIMRRSSADTIDVALKVMPKGKKVNSADTVEHAVEEGNVVLIDKRAADTKTHRAASESAIFAARAEYSGVTKQAVLTGSPRLQSAEISMSAAKITVSQATGDAAAEGDVKGTSAGQEGREAIHIIANRAELHRASDLAIFYGSANKDARLWQGSSQIIAPRIEMEQKKQQMRAYSAGGHSVRAVLPLRDIKKSQAKEKMFAGVATITAAQMTYDGKSKQPVAHLTGGVRLQQTTGTISAKDVTVVFKTSEQKNTSTAMPAGEVDGLRAEGDVRLVQPGRTGNGTLLVYTASKDEFELTGTPAAPPRIIDAERGSITGSSLIFHAGDDSVIVAATPGKRVHTETRVDR